MAQLALSIASTDLAIPSNEMVIARHPDPVPISNAWLNELYFFKISINNSLSGRGISTRSSTKKSRP